MALGGQRLGAVHSLHVVCEGMVGGGAEGGRCVWSAREASGVALSPVALFGDEFAELAVDGSTAVFHNVAEAAVYAAVVFVEFSFGGAVLGRDGAAVLAE